MLQQLASKRPASPELLIVTHDDLPPELLMTIFSYATPIDWLNWLAVCRTWYALFNTPKLWRNSISQHYPDHATLINNGKFTNQQWRKQAWRQFQQHSELQLDYAADKLTGFMTAVKQGNRTLVQQAITAGVDCNYNDGETALTVAAGNNYPNIVALLLAQPGLLANQVDADGMTALMWAAYENYPRIIAAKFIIRY